MQCQCFLNHDMLFVQMAAGFFGGFGYSIKIDKNKFELVYFEEKAGGSFFKTDPNDTAFSDRAEVSSKYQTLILNQKPTMKPGQQLTGFATYTSVKYYVRKLRDKLDTTYVAGRFYFTCKTTVRPDDR